MYKTKIKSHVCTYKIISFIYTHKPRILDGFICLLFLYKKKYW